MGAVNFIEFKASDTAKNAFYELDQEALYEYGHDAYNGTISTCTLVPGEVKVADFWSEYARKWAYTYAELHDWGNKWEARALNCGKTEDGLTMYAFYGMAAC